MELSVHNLEISTIYRNTIYYFASDVIAVLKKEIIIFIYKCFWLFQRVSPKS